MNKYIVILSQFLVIGVIILNGFTVKNSAAQDILTTQTEIISDVRPFDFSDKFYEANGVEPGLIINRRNGDDKLSVFDFIRDERHRNVRIIGTYPAYDRDGKMIYWNHYGDLYEESFTQSPTGQGALELANYYPIFTFPSETIKHSDRQAVLIATDENYFEKNFLGLGVFVSVEFTELAATKEGQIILEAMAQENGISLDGTPIIKTMRQLNYLVRQGIVRQTVRGTTDKSETPYAIAKIIDNVERGAITPDAFLIYVSKPNSTNPLPAEEMFVSNFECLKDQSETCGTK